MKLASFVAAIAVPSLLVLAACSAPPAMSPDKGFGENPIEFVGPHGLARMIAQVDASFQKTMHNVFNQTFDRADDGGVTGHTTCIASHVLPGDDWILLDMAIRYHNRYSLEGGDWKFAERLLEVMWVETRSVQQFNPAMMSNDPGEFG